MCIRDRYEIVSTINPRHITRVKKYAKKHHIRLYEIGFVSKGTGVFYQENNKLTRIENKRIGVDF